MRVHDIETPREQAPPHLPGSYRGKNLDSSLMRTLVQFARLWTGDHLDVAAILQTRGELQQGGLSAAPGGLGIQMEDSKRGRRQN